jgi:glutamyl-tRNA reductase
MVNAAMGAGRNLVLIDIAMPRGIDPAAAVIPGVHLMDIDSLKEAREDPRTREEMARAEELITGELADLAVSMEEHALRPVLAGLWQKAEGYRAEVLSRTRRRVPHIDDDSWRHVENLSRALVAKLLHDPATRLRAEAGNGHAREDAAALRHLFNLAPGREGPRT